MSELSGTARIVAAGGTQCLPPVDGGFAGCATQIRLGAVPRLVCFVLVLSVAACDLDSARRAAPAAPSIGPAPAAAAPVAELESHTGRSYADFVATDQARFGFEALGLDSTEAARIAPIVETASGAVLDGGGAQALVFRGCSVTGCADGVAVVAVDGATGAVFVGVRDGGGKDVLVPHDRLEALLRLNATTRDWVDAGVAPDVAGRAPPEPDSRP
jgi:hypothetical protein